MPGHRSPRILRRPNLAQSDILMSRCSATQRPPAGENGPYRTLEVKSYASRRVNPALGERGWAPLAVGATPQ